MTVSFGWSGLIQILLPFAVAYVVYRLGLAAYKRQKEREIIVERYLSGGVDQVAAHSQYMLSVFRHNWSEGLALLKKMKALGTSLPQEDFAARFETLDSGALDVRAHYRLNALIGDMVFYETHQDAVVIVSYASTFFRDDLSQAARLLSTGTAAQGDVETSYLPYIQALDKLVAPHYQLLAQIQRIAAELETVDVHRKTLKTFRTRPEVMEAVNAARVIRSLTSTTTVSERFRDLVGRQAVSDD